jgi:hypothetical protein
MPAPPTFSIDANGVTFIVTSSGFGGHTTARDNAIRRIERALQEQSATVLTRLDDAALEEIAALGVRAETAEWRCWRPGYMGELPTLKLMRR